MVSPELLRRYPFFGDLTDAQLKSIAMISEEVEVPEVTHLFSEGHSADHLYLLMNGSVDLTFTSQEEFRPETKKLKIHPGEYVTVNFYAENKTDKPMVAQAIPSISPGPAAEFFKKTECFCFTEQTFKAREGKTMPVRFVVNPELPEQYKTITLAYTFFDNTETSVKK